MAVIRISWAVDDLEDIIAQFDTQKVYRSTIDTPYDWVEITDVGTRVDLVAGQTDYDFTDTAGATTYYYSVAYYNTSTQDESDKSDPRLGDLAIRYLTRTDMDNLIGAHRVNGYFDDDVSGDTETTESLALYEILERAEGHADSFLMLRYGTDAITTLANNDKNFKSHVAWIACEFAAERRPEFLDNEGKGPFSYQFDRAERYFKKLAAGRKRSQGEGEAGVGSNVGGSLKPTLPSGTSRFTFAPDDDNPTGHGGF